MNPDWDNVMKAKAREPKPRKTSRLDPSAAAVEAIASMPVGHTVKVGVWSAGGSVEEFVNREIRRRVEALTVNDLSDLYGTFSACEAPVGERESRNHLLRALGVPDA